MSESAATTRAVDRFSVRVALRTDVGKVRSENQDFATFTEPSEERDRRPGGRLMIVADGMGGHRGGATASRMAADVVKERYLEAASDDIPEALRQALQAANAKIWAEAQANPDLRGMGTTTSALVVRDREAWFAHVGDSRIYWVRGDEIRQVTEDHSLVASMVREGLLTTQEAESHPRRNVLQRSMGVGEEVDIDIKGPLDLKDGDTFILCSDGLHGLVKEEELKEVARLPVEQAADEFVRRALDRGAPDNVTVIVARAEAVDDEPTLVEAQDSELFEDTVRDRLTPSGTEPPAAEPDKPRAETPPEPGGAPARPHSFGAGVVKWALLFVVMLGAAGAFLFWNQQQGFARESAKTSNR